jgi:hypothetical protein
MKMNARGGKIQPHRLGVAKKMNLVAACRELSAESRRENSTSSD